MSAITNSNPLIYIIIIIAIIVVPSAISSMLDKHRLWREQRSLRTQKNCKPKHRIEYGKVGIRMKTMCGAIKVQLTRHVKICLEHHEGPEIFMQAASLATDIHFREGLPTPNYGDLIEVTLVHEYDSALKTEFNWVEDWKPILSGLSQRGIIDVMRLSENSHKGEYTIRVD